MELENSQKFAKDFMLMKTSDHLDYVQMMPTQFGNGEKFESYCFC